MPCARTNETSHASLALGWIMDVQDWDLKKKNWKENETATKT